MVRKGNIKLGLKQVKVGAQGRYGELAGRELTGDFEQSAAPLYLWLRRDGRLELISGRHRFAKMMEDDKVEAHMCYVFIEDAAHDERWATMLDYENNMRDDQADEKTAAVYIRTMPQGDEELYRKGLLRNATKSKRGIFIGRHARQNLFDLLMDDKVSAKDAEVICQLTQNLRDEARVEEIQSRAASLLKDGKSWEYIGAMTQLLANKERVTMRQGLLDLGADFEADLEKMARCVELNMQALKESIGLMKQGRRLSKDKRAAAERLGLVTQTGEDSEGKLAALTQELTRWEYIGSYPDLIAAVQLWDGETVPDPVGRVLEEYERGRAQAGQQEERGQEFVPEGQGAFDFSASVRDGRGVFEVDGNEARDFARRVQEVFAAEKKPKKGFIFRVCSYPEVMKLIFPWEGDVMIRWDNLEKLQSKHGMTPEQIGKLPAELCDPIAIFEDSTQERDYVVVTELEAPARDGKVRKVAAILKLRGSDDGQVLVSFVSSAYARSKDDTKYAGLLKNDRLRYLDKARAGEWASLEETFTSQLLSTKLANPSSEVILKENVADVKGDVSFSVSEVKERGLMKDGKLEAVNGVLVDGGTDFSASVDFSHVSRALFRRPDREHVGTGEGNQVYGWGCIYGAENPRVNRSYHKQFTTIRGVFVQGPIGKQKRLSKEEVLAGLRARGLSNKRVLAEVESWWHLRSKEELERDKEESEEQVMGYEELLRKGDVKGERERKEIEGWLDYWRGNVLVADYFIEHDILVKNDKKQYPVNYRMRADVDDGNLLHWDEKLDGFLEEHPDVAAAFGELLNVDFDMFFDVSARNIPTREGWLLYEQLAKKLGSARAASEWLDEHGIRGVKYEDGMSRDKEEDKTYNYVIFNPDYIEVIAINNRHAWSEYSEDNPDWQRPEDVDFSASVRNLAAVHTLSVEKFLAAGKMGGMPLPSVAVTRLDRPYKWGEKDDSIALVGRPEMVNPELGALVYGRDAWTSIFPHIDYLYDVKRDAAERLLAEVREVERLYEGEDKWAVGRFELDGLVKGLEGLLAEGRGKGYNDGGGTADYFLSAGNLTVLDAYRQGARSAEEIGEFVKRNKYGAAAREFARVVNEQIMGERKGYFNERGTYVPATLENVTEYMRGRKMRAAQLGRTPYIAFLTQRFDTMEEVRGQRERIGGKDETERIEGEVEEWLEESCKRYGLKGYNKKEWSFILSRMADVKEVTEEAIVAALQDVSREHAWGVSGVVDLRDFGRSGALDEGSYFLERGVAILKELRAAQTDYLEAVPRRAVRMDEWVYAIYTSRLRNKEEVRRVCRENGIVPIEYKASQDTRDFEAMMGMFFGMQPEVQRKEEAGDEEGLPESREVVLRDLIDDGEVSMSVRNLAAVHSLSVENFLRQAREWGGMPLPSVAVTRLDRPYDWDVDHEPMVMLVGRPGMVDPERGAEVYARDAWMGRMPEVEEEAGEDGVVRRFFYDENDERVEATLENVTGYLMRRKRKGSSAQEVPDAARALMARRLVDMKGVKGRRRMLQAEPENRVTDGEIYEWMDMATEYDWGWSAAKARTLFGVLGDVEDVTKGGVFAAIMGSKEEDLVELQNGLDEDSAFIAETVRILREMRRERRNYVEATPRRVVGMDEWVYAVYQDDVPQKDEVRRVCREHGIVPVEYKAGERDRALGDLIDDGEVSFSVIGEHARTWDKYKDRAFAGRDDGRMRAEIDASRARLTGRVAWGDVLARELEGDLAKMYDIFHDDGKREEVRAAIGYTEEATGEGLLRLAHRYGLLESVPVEEAILADVARAVMAFNHKAAALELADAMRAAEGEEAGDEEAGDEGGEGLTLGEVLDYPELYEAYPQLKDIKVELFDRARSYDGAYGNGKISLFRRHEPEGVRRVLLHEVQHAIQGIEGFARGSNTRKAGGFENYLRSAGEIEARNVEARADMTGRERLERAFNETLEYPGEAIVDFSASVVEMDEARERYAGTEAAKAVEKVVTSLRGKVKDAVTRAELEERVPEEDRKGLISQEEELIMPANEGVIDAVKAATGRDVTGYYHAVSEDRLWHAILHHGQDSTSTQHVGQLDLTWDDFALLPDILDTGTPEVKSYPKSDTIIEYTKDYNGVVYKVRQRVGRKRRFHESKLSFVTEWIEKRRGSQGVSPDHVQGHSLGFPRDAIQSQGSEDVKGDFSRAMRDGGKRYRVVDDRVGLSEHLNDVVEPVELNVKLTGERKDWMGEARKFFVKYLAKRVLPIGETGFTLHTDGANTPRTSAAKVTTERGARAFEQLEEVIGKAVHLGSEGPQHRERETKKRKDLMDRSNSVEFFGYPMRVNGDLYLAWFNGTTKKKGRNDKEEPDQKQVRLYEVGFQPVKTKGNSPQLTDLKSDAKGVPLTGVTMAEVLQNVNEKSEWMPEIVEDEGFSGAMREGSMEERVMAIMRGEVADAEGVAVADEWGKFLAAFSLASVGEDEREAGKMLGRMLALVAATRRVLPEGFKRGTNGLGLQAAWLRWYAQMAETGQVTRSTELSGKVYERVREELLRRHEREQLSYTEEEAMEMLKGYAGQKMGTVVESMARGCRRMLDTYLREKMRQDMLETIERLYPKREPGEHWKRGRATGETYRYAEVVRELLLHGSRALLPNEEHEAEVSKCEKVLAKGNISNHTRETYERRLENLRRKEENALYQEVEKLEGVLEDAEASEEEREAARERLFFLMTFGGWNSKDYKEAASVKAQFDRVIKEGRKVWAERMKERKAQVDLYKSRVRATKGWRRVGVLGEAIIERTQKGDNLKAKTRGFVLSLTNMAGKLNAYKKELGTYFVSRMLGDLADIHVNLKRKQDEMMVRVMDILARASGRRNVENLSQWVRDNNVMQRTGIMITQPQSFRVTYTKEQIDKYLAMTSEEREELRRTKAERELKAGRTLEPVPSEGELEELRAQVMRSLKST